MLVIFIRTTQKWEKTSFIKLADKLIPDKMNWVKWLLWGNQSIVRSHKLGKLTSLKKQVLVVSYVTAKETFYRYQQNMCVSQNVNRRPWMSTHTSLQSMQKRWQYLAKVLANRLLGDFTKEKATTIICSSIQVQSAFLNSFIMFQVQFKYKVRKCILHQWCIFTCMDGIADLNHYVILFGTFVFIGLLS